MQTVTYTAQDGREIVNTFPRRSRREWNGTLADHADANADWYARHLNARADNPDEPDELEMSIRLARHDLSISGALTNDPYSNSGIIFAYIGGGRHDTRLALRVLLACGLTVADLL